MLSMKRKNSTPIRRGLIWNSVSNVSRYGLTFVGTMVLARLLSPADFGLIGIISVFIAVAEVLTDSGLGGAIIKKIGATETDFRTLTTYNIAASVILYLLYYALAPCVSDWYGELRLTNMIRIYSVVILIHSFAIAPKVLMTKQLRFKALSLINLASGVLGLAAGVLLAVLGYGVYSLIGQYIVHSLAYSALTMAVSRYRIRLGFSRASFVEQFEFGMNSTAANILNSISGNILGNFISKTSGIILNGYYTQSNRLLHAPQNFILNLIDSTLFPVLSQIGDRKAFSERIRKINGKTRLIIVILFGAGFTCCKELIYVLLGEKWMEAEWTFRILFVAAAFICLGNVERNVLKCLGYTRTILICEVLFFLSILVSLLAGWLTGGYETILYGYLASCILKCFILHWMSGRHIGPGLAGQFRMIFEVLLPFALLAALLLHFEPSGIYILDGLLKISAYGALSLLYIWINRQVTRK